MTSYSDADFVTAKIQWHDLALRHLQMARSLDSARFLDGAMFHVYHAYECMLGALISHHKYYVPPQGRELSSGPGDGTKHYPGPLTGIRAKSDHLARLALASQLINDTHSYHMVYGEIAPFIYTDIRSRSLYFDIKNNKWPSEQFTQSDVRKFLEQVEQFVREAWDEIKEQPA